jgi:hypothetical protein
LSSLFTPSNNSPLFTPSNNDILHILLFDLVPLSLLLQHTSLSPDGKLVIIVGDDTDALLIDANSGKVSVLLQKSV